MSFTPASRLIAKAQLINQTISSGVNILATGLVPTQSPGTFRITVAISGSIAQFSNVSIQSGTPELEDFFNQAVKLNADALYTFTYGVTNAFTYNFRLHSDGAIKQLLVEEVTGGVI